MQHTPLGVIVTVVALLATLALRNHYKEADHRYQAARQIYEQTKTIAPPGGVPQAHYTDPKSSRDEWRTEQDLEAQREMARWAWWTMVATWVGVFLLFATLYESGVTARAAIDAVELARLTSEQELRAYVGCMGIIIEPGQEGSIALVFKNSGVTPAYELRTWINYWWNAPPSALPPDFDFPDFPEERPFVEGATPSVCVLQPGEDKTVYFPIYSTVFNEARAGQCALFMYGRATYRTFGTERLSQFCFKYTKLQSEDGVLRDSFMLLDRHNRYT